jgi:excisionase family DNA binding protein
LNCSPRECEAKAEIVKAESRKEDGAHLPRQRASTAGGSDAPCQESRQTVELKQEGESLLTKKDMANYFKVTPRCIGKWMANGVVVYFKLGSKVRFRLSDVLDHLERNHRGCRRES